MSKVVVFADNIVGLRTLEYIYSNYPNDIKAVFIVDGTNNIYDAILAIGINKSLIYNANSLNQAETIEFLKFLKLDYIILAWWPYIIKKPILEIPSSGVINFHPSYLPHNRGKHYNFWTIVEETPFGVTLHYVSEGIDDGKIISQEVISKSWEDNGKTLYYRAQKTIIDLFKKTYPKLRVKNILGKKQDLRKGTFHFAHEIDEASMINYKKKYELRSLLNLIRARTFPPYPSCKFIKKKSMFSITVDIKRAKYFNASIHTMELQLDKWISLFELFPENIYKKKIERHFFFYELNKLYNATIYIVKDDYENKQRI